MKNLATTDDLLHLFGDPTRVRLMMLLSQNELSVADLVTITQVGQSRVSTHLGRLRSAGVVRDRKQGSSTLYSISDSMPEHMLSLWQLLSGDLTDPILEEDRARTALLFRTKEQKVWPDEVAGEMDRHYSPGRTWESLCRGMVELLDLGDVLDIGAGDGAVAQLVAPYAQSVTCVDQNERVVEAASRRMAKLKNVQCVQADMHQLPFEDESFDQIFLFHVLTCTRRPSVVLKEAARVLREGGRLVVLSLAEHKALESIKHYQQVLPGMRPSTLQTKLQQAGLRVRQCSITAREKRPPHFEVISAMAIKPSPSITPDETRSRAYSTPRSNKRSP